MMRVRFSYCAMLAILVSFLSACGASSFDEKFDETQRELETEMIDQQSELEAQINEELSMSVKEK